MIFTLLQVVMPVFLVIGGGFLSARFTILSRESFDAVMRFVQQIAIPSLLFRAVSTLDLAAVFDWRLLASFYIAATTSFVLGIIGARLFFARRPGEAVAIGFAALFSNSVLLGLPIMERAFGADALAPNFAIIAIHAPFCYLLGISVMEVSRADGRGAVQTLSAIGNAIIRNAITVALALGLVVNLTGLPLWAPITEALDMLARAALPGALFALGGILIRYRLSANLAEAGMITALSLVLHPALAYLLAGPVFDLPIGYIRSAVVTAAMAPGINAFIFASMYDRAKDTVASGVLLATGVSILSASAWLWLIG